ncbi:sigma factor-like helix-turn-helix DNA-binding protein [Mycobacterium sp. 1245852.3]|uniref:sigma factor-like helix-turn-helix DNA-binding protein n=1 Tax=Mycobacterium sp. 1245852.3 TaxID=1856860 RepID=UPI0009ED82D8|nr:sigma factor-like helix-turn-helix DNA-binding protein [Mycobacterium sp. 1245852.3]
MCQTPPRPWRDFVRPWRVALMAGASGLILAGVATSGHVTALTLIALGCVVVVTAGVMPAITQLEYGIPSLFKVVVAVANRGEELRREFSEQRPQLQVTANLLCDDPAMANDLLSAAIAEATKRWRGPVSAAADVYALCWFVHRLTAYSRLTGSPPPDTVPAANRALGRLSQTQRIILVLATYADLSVEDIADMVHLPPVEVDAYIAQADAALAAADVPGGDR